MKALNPRQRSFVDAMFVLGETVEYTQAARAAGYEGTEGSLRVQAHRLAHSDKVLAAIQEEAKRRHGAIVPMLQKKLENILQNDQHKDHFGAIKHAQALAGIQPTQKIEVLHKTDRESLVQQLRGDLDLLKAMGVNLDLGGIVGPVIDVTPEQEEVDEDWLKP